MGEGEAKRKSLVLAADGALAQKLDTWLDAQTVWAQAFAHRNVPSVYMDGNSDQGSANGVDAQFQQFMTLQNMKNLQELGLDMSIKK